MKRYIKCAINKSKALQALAEYEREFFYGNGYEVTVDQKRNCVVVERYGELQVAVTPAEVPVTVEGYKFRRATEADIASGANLYVREKYERQTVKQLCEPDEAVGPVDHKYSSGGNVL